MGTWNKYFLIAIKSVVIINKYLSSKHSVFAIIQPEFSMHEKYTLKNAFCLSEVQFTVLCPVCNCHRIGPLWNAEDPSVPRGNNWP